MQVSAKLKFSFILHLIKVNVFISDDPSLSRNGEAISCNFYESMVIDKNLLYSVCYFIANL